MSKKISFWSLVSLVIGSQIGSGAFLLPASLAQLGSSSLFGWLTSGTGALLLALVFAKLSLSPSKGGGPHAYVEQAFGRSAAFFTAWTYWLISWISSIAVIIAAVGYLSALLPLTPSLTLSLEMLLIVLTTLINLRGASLSGAIELFLTLVKCLLLLLIPLAGIAFFSPTTLSLTLPDPSTLNTSTLMTFWGFIGLESATSATNLVENPRRTIPRAILLGTLVSALIYLLNSVILMGVIPTSELAASQAPYVTATHLLFGPSWEWVVAIAAFLACVGTLNAWVLTSGQIAVEAARQSLFPSFFALQNRYGAPYAPLLLSLLCTLPLLIFTLTSNILQQLNLIVDLSVITFILIYLVSTLAFFKLHRSPLALPVLLFCVWILASVPLSHLLLCLLFALSGLPIYLTHRAQIRAPAHPS